jgi:hypothetical protein
MRERMPLPPLDFDDRFNQAAAPGLVAAGLLRGGEPVQLLNMSERGPMEFELPRLFFGVSARSDARSTEHRPVLDTVLLEPSARRLELTWRALVPLPRRAGLLRAIRVVEKVWQ